jgi:AAA family ATP:ADP antiporter
MTTQSESNYSGFRSIPGRVLNVFTIVRPEEVRCVLLLTGQGFLVMVSYYLLRAVRDALILVEHSAEVRSYAQALSAAILIVLVLLYGRIYDATERKKRITAWIAVFFVTNLFIFAALGWSGMRIGLPFYVWVSIFNLMIVAQFWVLATDLLNIKAGQRLFPILAAGVALGAWIGSVLAEQLFSLAGPYSLMLLAGMVLMIAPVLGVLAEHAVPTVSASVHDSGDDRANAFGTIARDRFLFLIAAMTIILNWVSSTGDYLLASSVESYADSLAAQSDVAVDTTAIIGTFYGGFYAWVNLLTLLIQLFLVARIVRFAGISGALLVMPLIMIAGYALLSFMPILILIRIIKTFENALNYSLQNTIRHALFLPTETHQKYKGKTGIDTVFWRLGDLVQAGAIYIGVNLLGFGLGNFAALNVGLATLMLGTVIAIGYRYRGLVQRKARNHAPVLARPVPDFATSAGQEFSYAVAPDTFTDADPGDVLRLSARLSDGSPLPDWLHFDSGQMIFVGRPPAHSAGQMEVELEATDMEGLKARDVFLLRYHPV